MSSLPDVYELNTPAKPISWHKHVTCSSFLLNKSKVNLSALKDSQTAAGNETSQILRLFRHIFSLPISTHQRISFSVYPFRLKGKMEYFIFVICHCLWLLSLRCFRISKPCISWWEWTLVYRGVSDWFFSPHTNKFWPIPSALTDSLANNACFCSFLVFFVPARKIITNLC